MRHASGPLFLLLLAVPLALSAQSTTSPSQTELIQALWARIEKLEKRLAELERNGNGKQALKAVPAEPIAAKPSPQLPAQTSQHEHQPPQVTAEAQPTYPALKIAGFADFAFSATDQRGSLSGFNEGQFVLHFASPLSPKVNVFGELSLTARPDAGTGTPSATGFNTEVERVIVRYDQNDYFKVSFGRYHTPINWWNTAFHHGQWLQTSIDRPEMTRFGGRFIPVHFVGALVEGVAAVRGLNLNYNLGMGNGRGSVIARGGDHGDANSNRAWLVNLFVKPDRPFGLQAGGSVYRDRITLAPGREFREWITSAHLVWQKEDPEVIAEVANINHRPVGGVGSFNSQAYYIQLGYRLPRWENLWKPYYRFEYIHMPRADPLFGQVLTPDPVFRRVPTLANLAGSTLGVRYDISTYAAIKLEYRNQRRASGQPRVNAVFAQTSFTF